MDGLRLQTGNSGKHQSFMKDFAMAAPQVEILTVCDEKRQRKKSSYAPSMVLIVISLRTMTTCLSVSFRTLTQSYIYIKKSLHNKGTTTEKYKSLACTVKVTQANCICDQLSISKIKNICFSLKEESLILK